MAALINNDLKLKVSNAFKNLHDSFCREIVAYKMAGKIALATNSTYNSIYKKSSEPPNQNFGVISKTLNARIYYGEINENLFSPSNNSTGEQSKIRIPNGSAILILDQEGFDFMKSAKRVEVDGKIFGLSSDDAPIGMFERTHWQFLLTPIDT